MPSESLGDRMKWYERWGETQAQFPLGLPIVIRIDGKKFSSWTRGLARPWQPELQQTFQETAYTVMRDLLTEAVLAYGQSDEVTFVLRALDPAGTNPGQFGNVRRKIESLSVSAFTAAFNRVRTKHEVLRDRPDAIFDCRSFPVPLPVEAHNCVLWRQQDATRNSIQNAGRAVYSHQEMHLKDTNEIQEMLFQKGINWNDYPTEFKRGWAIRRVARTIPPEELTDIPEKFRPTEPVVRQVLDLDLEMPILTKDPQYVQGLLGAG